MTVGSEPTDNTMTETTEEVVNETTTTKDEEEEEATPSPPPTSLSLEDSGAVVDPWGGFAPIDQQIPIQSDTTGTVPSMLLPSSSSSSSAAAAPVPLRSRLSNFRNRVSERMAASKARRESANAAAKEATKKNVEEKAVTKLTELQEDEYEALRPSKISVSVIKDEQEPYGFSLDQKEGEKMLKRTVIISEVVDYGLLHKSPLKSGDYLRRINGQRATNAETAVQQLVGLKGRVTLEAETPQGNPAVIAAFVRKPSTGFDTDLGVTFVNTEQETVIDEDTDKNNDEKDVKTAGDSAEENSDDSPAEANADVDVNASQTDEIESATETATTTTKVTRLLQIGELTGSPSNDDGKETIGGLFADSVLSPGDLVMAINGTPCSSMDAEEAMELIRNSEQDTITIIALNPQAHAIASGPTRAQRFMRQAKRTSIGVGGGALVALGTVCIPLTPPPIGEVMIVAGVSVLGTEFEAPKRVMKSARDSLEMAVGRTEGLVEDGKASDDDDDGDDVGKAASEKDSSTLVLGEDQEGTPDDDSDPPTTTEEGAEEKNDNNEAADADVSDTDANNKPKWRRLKSFGRNYVLPFLDQVVGDRKHDDDVQEGEVGTATDDDNKKESESSSPDTPSTDISEVESTDMDNVPALSSDDNNDGSSPIDDDKSTIEEAVKPDEQSKDDVMNKVVEEKKIDS